MPKTFQKPDLGFIASLLKSLGLIGDEFVKDFNEHEADRMFEILHKHLDAQDLQWKELSKNYANYKNKQGLNPGMWLSTEELKNKLKIIRSEKGYYIGGAEGEIHSDSGLEVNHLITIHEVGLIGLGIPARPLFRPSQLEAKQGVGKRFLNKTKDLITSKLKHFFNF